MNDEGALQLALQNNHHAIAEMLLRDMTLKDAMKKDSSETINITV